jgi:hypothetical protein
MLRELWKVIVLLTQNSVHITFAIVGGIINFLPLYIGVESHVEESIYASSITGQYYIGINLFLLGLLAPLIIDTALDIMTSLPVLISSQWRRKREGSGKGNANGESLVGSTLNTAETVVFIVGMLLLPISAVLPGSNEKRALISLCCRKATTTLVGSAFASSLARYFTGSEREVIGLITSVGIICISIGGAVSVLTNNMSDAPAGTFYAVAITFQYTAGALILGNCLYWLATNLILPNTRFLSLSAKHSERNSERTPTESVYSDSGKAPAGEHAKGRVVFFRTIHTLTAVIYIVLQAALQIAYKIANNLTEMQAVTLSVPIIIWALSILIRSMRQVKLAAFENLVRVN